MAMVKLTILYKSGTSVYFKADNLVVTKSGGVIEKITWDKLEPRPLHLGIDEIAAILMGHV